MKFMLRYTAEAPLQPRPHEPTVPQFRTYGEAVEHLEAQPDHLMLEIVRRCCRFCTAGQPHPATPEHGEYELVDTDMACKTCGHVIPAEEVTPA